MSILAQVPIEQLRAAARAWRHSESNYSSHRKAAGWFKWLLPEPNMSIHDCVDNLIDEIERLRKQ